ncbi:MAG: hypothetical protein ACI9TH_002978 [Kiritimatiellia bacterium]|jgi:hypothetical protein
MPEEKTHYTRIPGKSSVLISTFTLHRAEDHLLYVEQPWFYQKYTRFYFRDIQSIVISESTAYVGLNIFLGGALTLAIVLTLLLFSTFPPASYFFAVMAITFLVLFVINLIKGPTCKFAIQTRVNRTRINSLSRKKTAHRALRIIEEQIRAYQDVRTQTELIDLASPAAFAPDITPPNPVRDQLAPQDPSEPDIL